MPGRRAAAIALFLVGLLPLATQAGAQPLPGAERERPGTEREGGGPPARTAAHQSTYRDACAPARPGHARCFARFATGPTPTGPASAGPASAEQAPSGYGPAELRSAYRLGPSNGGAGQTVAVVAAYDHPDAEADLGRYRAHFGLPACTAADGCFRKIDQRGGGAAPRPDDGWALEISLDLDMVSAVCPRCRILLVEADSAGLRDLGAAVSQAAAQGATAISNSYGVPESPPVKPFNAAFNHPGHAVTAAAGDTGYGLYFPASSQYVTAVGGTTLTRSSSRRGWTESAWSGGGSGCSRLFPKPSWQADRSCSGRTVADVSAVADPATGVAVYHTYGAGTEGGGGLDGGPWYRVGGTSVSAPIVAGLYALAGNAGAARPASHPYRHPGSFHDVTFGANGSCGGSYLCTAAAGYDGPSGLGTPDGSGAF